MMIHQKHLISQQPSKAGGSEEMKIKRLINRLVQWLRAHSISGEQIADCIDYITK